MRILLAGDNQLLIFLTKSLRTKGYDITVISESEELCRTLADTYEIISVHGDGTTPAILADANTSNMDMVIALNDKDAWNLMVCEIARKQFHINRTCAIVHNPKNVSLFKELGVDYCVCSTQSLENLIDQVSMVETIQSYIPQENGKVKIYEMELCDDSPVLNKKLWEINFPKGCIIGCIIRMDQTIIPQGNLELKPKDKVILISSSDAIEKTTALLSGKYS